MNKIFTISVLSLLMLHVQCVYASVDHSIDPSAKRQRTEEAVTFWLVEHTESLIVWEGPGFRVTKAKYPLHDVSDNIILEREGQETLEGILYNNSIYTNGAPNRMFWPFLQDKKIPYRTAYK